MIHRRALLSGLAATVASPALARVPASPESALWQGMALTDQTGRSFQLGASTAPVTLVAFWAQWCPGCHMELSSLAALAAELGPKVDVLLLSHPEYWAEDRAALRQRRSALRHAVPAASNGAATIAAALTIGGAYRVPRALAFRTQDGNVAWTQRGTTDWSSAGVAGRVRALVG